MHMPDALISPTVAGIMLSVSFSIATFSTKKVKQINENYLIPLMGVLGAFVFAIQMINFSIPATGSSGHLVGSLLLAIILGRYAGFLTIMVVLLIQALFFGDGGLLAYGCNVFNMAFFACFIGYPVYQKILTCKTNKQLAIDINNDKNIKRKIFIACLCASVISSQFGAFALVLETMLSFKTEIPFNYFTIAMQFSHLIIGIVEGLITASIVIYLQREKPEILSKNLHNKTNYATAIVITLIALFIGGVVSLFASEKPDGLEWSISKTFTPMTQETTELTAYLEKLAIFKNYNIHNTQLAHDASQSLAAVIGVSITLLVTIIIGMIITRRRIVQNKSDKNKSF